MISKVRVRETAPDKVLDNADEVVLVDSPPDELLRRLAEDKIYVEDTAVRAVDNFLAAEPDGASRACTAPRGRTCRRAPC